MSQISTGEAAPSPAAKLLRPSAVGLRGPTPKKAEGNDLEESPHTAGPKGSQACDDTPPGMSTKQISQRPPRGNGRPKPHGKPPGLKLQAAGVLAQEFQNTKAVVTKYNDTTRSAAGQLLVIQSDPEWAWAKDQEQWEGTLAARKLACDALMSTFLLQVSKAKNVTQLMLCTRKSEADSISQMKLLQDNLKTPLDSLKALVAKIDRVQGAMSDGDESEPEAAPTKPKSRKRSAKDTNE